MNNTLTTSSQPGTACDFADAVQMALHLWLSVHHTSATESISESNGGLTKAFAQPFLGSLSLSLTLRFLLNFRWWVHCQSNFHCTAGLLFAMATAIVALAITSQLDWERREKEETGAKWGRMEGMIAPQLLPNLPSWKMPSRPIRGHRGTTCWTQPPARLGYEGMRNMRLA